MGCGAYKRRKAGNLKGTKLLAAEPGAQLPTPSQRHKPLLPPKHKVHFLQLPAHSREDSFLRRPLAHDSEHWYLCEHGAASGWWMGKVPHRVSWCLLWSSGLSARCQSRRWQSYPWCPGTSFNFMWQPEQLGSERSRLQPSSARVQTAFTCSLDHRWTTPPEEAMLRNTEV